jgi:hypothetical protein
MPNPFDEYINKLEGKSDIDPLAVVRDLRELHTQELGTREAKITELTGSVAEKDTIIIELGQEITVQKAKNYDLVNEIPNPADQNVNHDNDDSKPDPSSIKIADLFKPNVRNRHGL